MPDLSGKVAIVTGATQGIGRAIAEALVDHGASVAVGARTEERLEETERALSERAERSGRKDRCALAVRCDVREPEDCEGLIERAVEAFGGLDILVNNAGVGRFDPVEAMSTETWDEVIGTNLNSLFYCSHHAIPHLKRRGEAWILNIGSLAGKNAFPGGAAYNASKFGLIGFSEALMQDVRHDGIRVSYIMPGSVATHFSHPTPGTADDWKIQPEDVARLVLDLLAMPSRTLPSRIEVRPSRPPKK